MAKLECLLSLKSNSQMTRLNGGVGCRQATEPQVKNSYVSFPLLVFPLHTCIYILSCACVVVVA